MKIKKNVYLFGTSLTIIAFSILLVMLLINVKEIFSFYDYVSFDDGYMEIRKTFTIVFSCSTFLISILIIFLAIRNFLINIVTLNEKKHFLYWRIILTAIICLFFLITLFDLILDVLTKSNINFDLVLLCIFSISCIGLVFTFLPIKINSKEIINTTITIVVSIILIVMINSLYYIGDIIGIILLSILSLSIIVTLFGLFIPPSNYINYIQRKKR